MSELTNRQWIMDYQSAGCSMFQVDANEAFYYPDRADMLVGFSVVPELWHRAHSGGVVVTTDLAKHGEVFCYVKLDGLDGLKDSAFNDREEIEDALDEALSEAGVGCIIGAGTGRFYSYVDLALIELPQAFAIIRRVLQRGKISKRSWILHFDNDMREHWIGIWNDSPAPPN